VTRALVYDRYGGLDVLEEREIVLPPPKPGEIRVRVRAAALNPKDAFVRKGRFAALSGRRFPKLVGVDFAGETDAGDRVFGALEEFRYLRGTVAEHVVVPAHEWAPMPASLSFEEAAALPLAALTSLQALRDLGRVRPGDRVAIHGASGGVGTAAIQIARALGARVTTTSSADNLDLCRSLGAEEALDRTRGPLDGGRFEVVFDVFGNLSFAGIQTARALAPRGVFISTVPSLRILADAARTLASDQRARLVVVRSRRADLDTLRQMVGAGTLEPVIDRVEPFARAVEALRHLESKRARGKIVVRIDPV
jgi:NADPH:quinone reductase-like Zn-dependent oxidoreductase